MTHTSDCKEALSRTYQTDASVSKTRLSRYDDNDIICYYSLWSV